jgi:hypothetical protein
MDFGERLAMAKPIRNRLLDYQGKAAQVRAEEGKGARLEQNRVRRLKMDRERQERLWRAKERSKQQERKVCDLENRLNTWVGKCPLCYIRQHQGNVIDARHPLKECSDKLRDLVIEEVEVLQRVRLDRSGGCNRCGMPRKMWLRWKDLRAGSPCFDDIEDSQCRFQGIVRSVVAAILTAGPLEIVEEAIYSRLKAQGIWGEGEKLELGEVQEVQQGMLRWFGEEIEWGDRCKCFIAYILLVNY